MAIQNFETFMTNLTHNYASLVTRHAKEAAPNTHIKQSIHSTVNVGQGKYVILLIASGPDAKAREFGSGIHARSAITSKNQLGPHGKILIRPRNKKYLAFNWELANDSIPRLPDGRVLLKEVKHPGVEAANGGKGYLFPSVDKTNSQIKKQFVAKVGNSIVLDIRASLRTSNAR